MTSIPNALTALVMIGRYACDKPFLKSLGPTVFSLDRMGMLTAFMALALLSIVGIVNALLMFVPLTRPPNTYSVAPLSTVVPSARAARTEVMDFMWICRVLVLFFCF